VIYLPKFYIDFENKDGRDAGKDIALEVERLKAAQVDGIVLMFVMMEEGHYQQLWISLDCSSSKVPLFKLNQQEERKRFYSIEIKKIEWDGPLVIMVNSFSSFRNFSC
jgi:carboxyl-terminal processing protease